MGSLAAGAFFLKEIGTERRSSLFPLDGRPAHWKIVAMGRKHFLLTGRPGVGKTTLLQKIAKQLHGVIVGGFFTEEIRDHGTRTGFEVQTFDGRRGTLARAKEGTGPRVGKYLVDLADFERVGVSGLADAVAHAQVILVDEIGKMELFSEPFRRLLMKALEGTKPVIATIMSRPHPLTDSIKNRPDVQVVEITYSNRDHLAKEIADEVRTIIRKA